MNYKLNILGPLCLWQCFEYIKCCFAHFLAVTQAEPWCILRKDKDKDKGKGKDEDEDKDKGYLHGLSWWWRSKEGAAAVESPAVKPEP